MLLHSRYKRSPLSPTPPFSFSHARMRYNPSPLASSTRAREHYQQPTNTLTKPDAAVFASLNGTLCIIVYTVIH